MSDSAPPIVVLTDGEANLAHYMDLLRTQGERVLATSRPYEVMLFVERHRPSGVILRACLLPEPAEDFLRQIRDFPHRPFVILTSQDTTEAEAPRAELADLRLAEPYRYSTLLEALEYARERQRRSDAMESTPRAERDSASEFTPRLRRLVQLGLRLTELERDRDSLIATGLEAFLEISNTEQGALFLRPGENSPLELLRRTSEWERELPAVELLAAAVIGDPNVRIATLGEGSGAPVLLVPLLEQRVPIGAAILGRPRGGEPFAESTIELCSSLAAQFSTNLLNARKWEDLHRMAVIDQLTGLFNRRFFERQISVELERARRYDRQVTLALIDIDHFKVINDLNGYAAGDQLIRAAAEIIRKSFREVDVVTRWGGDEFAILLPETGKPRLPMPGEAASVNYVERVRKAVESADFRRVLPSLTGRITVSAGVATFPVDARDKESLFAAANLALRRAKRTGNNRVCVAGEDLQMGVSPPLG